MARLVLLLYSATRFYSVGFSVGRKKKEKEGREGGGGRKKKNTLRKGKKRGKRKHIRFRFATRKRARSRHSLVGTSIALSHASQQMHLIKHIFLFFLYTRENCAPHEINTRRTTVKDPLRCAFPLLAGII